MLQLLGLNRNGVTIGMGTADWGWKQVGVGGREGRELGEQGVRGGGSMDVTVS